MPVVGVDVGGTFTDVVSWDGAALDIDKVPTTPDPSDAVAAAVTGEVDLLLHGTTAATNALLERRGAETALVTTTGFEDAIEIGRQDRPSLYDTDADRPAPLVPRSKRFGDSDLDAVDDTADSIAIALIGAHLEPSQERRLAAELAAAHPGAAISVSHAVSPEVREFERTSTTVLNAYLKPVVADYLQNLAERLPGIDHLNVMRSSGGLMTPSRAGELPTAILLSGPAGGAMAAAALATAMGKDRVIAFDMGGTSTDVSRIEAGRPEVAYERAIDGYPCRMPSVAIHTVGAGGGSIAWRDSGGALQVGPRSAGATPGPACYQRGGRLPTVTDANLAMGRLTTGLGDHLNLDRSAADDALGTLGLAPATAAAGVVSIVEENMAQAIRHISIEEGVDPATATLVAFGGAGGLHATALARSLGMESVIIPPWPGVFSALGLLVSPSRADATVAVPPRASPEQVAGAVTAAAAAARDDLGAMTGSTSPQITTLVDLRYRGQSHEITVPWDPEDGWQALTDAFHRIHRDRNGFSRPDDPVEPVAARAEAIDAAALTLDEVPHVPESGSADRGHVDVVEDGATVTARVLWRPALVGEISGPAVLTEPTSTTLLRSTERAVVAPNGALVIEW